MKLLKKYFPVLLIVIGSYWAISPFFHSGFFPIHDNTQVQRVFEMSKALHDGMFPVRWVADLGYGYGYPIFNFYAPFVYYLGGFINLLGFDSLLATKIVMGGGILLSGIAMYLFAREFWGRAGGIISALLYVYAPYHALDIYVRGDVAEFWAYAFLPLAFLGVYKVFTILHQSKDLATERSKIKDQRSKVSYKRPRLNELLNTQNLLWVWVCIGALSYAAIIISHNLTAMMVTPFLFVWALGYYFVLRGRGKKYHPYFVLLSLLLGICLGAFYWLPTLTELKYTNVLSQVGGGADYHDHFVCLSQLWDSPWGFGGSTRGCLYDGLSFKIGKVHILLALFSLIGIALFWKKDKQKSGVVLFALVSLIFVIFLMVQQSQFIWDAIPQMAFFQYPWRFLLMTAFFTSFLSGISIVVIDILLGRVSKAYGSWGSSIVTLLIIGIVLFINAKLFVPQFYLTKTVTDYTNHDNLSWDTSRISDEYLPKGFLSPKSVNQVPITKIITRGKPITVLISQEKTQFLTAEIIAKQKTDILINQAYFPGWHIFIDGQQVWFRYFNRGLLVAIPQGKHQVSLRFSQTPVELIGDGISVASFFVLLLGIIWLRKSRYEAKKA